MTISCQKQSRELVTKIKSRYLTRISIISSSGNRLQGSKRALYLWPRPRWRARSLSPQISLIERCHLPKALLWPNIMLLWKCLTSLIYRVFKDRRHRLYQKHLINWLSCIKGMTLKKGTYSLCRSTTSTSNRSQTKAPGAILDNK